jgi:hypothetical protein
MTVACEEEWKRWEAHNYAAQWGVKAVGWEATPPASLIGRVDVAGAGIWLSTEELVNAQVTAWPGFPPDYITIKVSMEECSSVGELIREHSACRLIYDIAC